MPFIAPGNGGHRTLQAILEKCCKRQTPPKNSLYGSSEASSTMPRSMTMSNILPGMVKKFLVTGAVNVDQMEWESGYMANAGRTISGEWLKYWIEIGAVLSGIGAVEAQISSCAYQVLGMADLGFLPKFFGVRSKRFNTPWVGILLATVMILAISYMDFTDIVGAANFLYSLGMLLEISAFVWLRWKFPAMKRPYRVPLRLPALVIMCLIPCGFLVVIMVIATKTVFLISGLMILGSIGWYFLIKYAKLKKWFAFNNGNQYKIDILL